MSTKVRACGRANIVGHIHGPYAQWDSSMTSFFRKSSTIFTASIFSILLGGRRPLIHHQMGEPWYLLVFFPKKYRFPCRCTWSLDAERKDQLEVNSQLNDARQTAPWAHGDINVGSPPEGSEVIRLPWRKKEPPWPPSKQETARVWTYLPPLLL